MKTTIITIILFFYAFNGFSQKTEKSATPLIATDHNSSKPRKLGQIPTAQLIELAKQQNGIVEIIEGDTIIATPIWKVIRSTNPDKYIIHHNIDTTNLQITRYKKSGSTPKQ